MRVRCQCAAALTSAACLLAATVVSPSSIVVFCAVASPPRMVGSLRFSSYSELMERYNKLAEDIQRIEQELDADNEGQVAAACARSL
jgi:hypothetical protein